MSVAPNLLLLAVLFAGSASSPKEPSFTVDLKAFGGAAFDHRSTGAGVGAAFAYGLAVGSTLRRPSPWPLRLEAFASSDTFGGGEDVDSVRLDAWHCKLLVLGGVEHSLWQQSTFELGIDLLAGLGMRAQRVSIRVGDSEKATRTFDPIAGVVLGPYVEVWQLRCGVRVLAEFPLHRLVTALLEVGFSF